MDEEETSLDKIKDILWRFLPNAPDEATQELIANRIIDELHLDDLTCDFDCDSCGGGD